ncbi:MAG: 30S ribosomal protein S1 [Holosporales bacterium]|jgi:small subunit ribosomal protein S1|nr:30S ribosomal protein S1 [Holosporales bacterium]
MNTVNQTKNQKTSFAEMLQEELFGTEPLEGKVVKGTIINIKNDKAMIDVGLKSEGRIFVEDIKTLKGTDNVTIGETVDVFVEKFEDKNGEPILSIEKAKKEAVWNELEKNLNSDITVEGVIIGRTRGGFSVDINGTLAFLPGSQVDLRIIKDITPLMNVKQPLKILKMDRARNNIVVSRRSVLEASRFEAKAEVMSKLSEGMIIEGIVKNITEYGAFVDIGGVDGLLHVTDMSWKRVHSPSSVVTVGDTVKVVVLKFNTENGRISLGMKQLVTSPWENIDQKYIVGEKYKGKIVNITDYGVFVEIGEGIEGMVYMTELSWTKKNVPPSKLFNIADEIEVMVLEADSEKRKISLSVKQCTANPWKEFSDNHPIGSKIKGIVKNATEFGIFIGVSEELDGMIHMSDVSWKGTGNLDDKQKPVQKGQEIEVVVLDINPEKERISLGIKQLEANPYEEATKKVNKNDVVIGEVISTQTSGANIKLENGLAGFIKKGDISREKMRQRSDTLGIGEKIEAIVLGIEKSGVINLSIKELELQREKEAVKRFGSTDSGASLGDILGAAMVSANVSVEDTQKTTAAKPKATKKLAEE